MYFNPSNSETYIQRYSPFLKREVKTKLGHFSPCFKLDHLFFTSLFEMTISGCRYPNEMGVKYTVFRNYHSFRVYDLVFLNLTRSHVKPILNEIVGGSNGWFPLVFDPRTSRTPAPWPGRPSHRVSLPGQRIRAHLDDSLMTQSHLIHFSVVKSYEAVRVNKLFSECIILLDTPCTHSDVIIILQVRQNMAQPCQPSLQSLQLIQNQVWCFAFKYYFITYW